MSSFPLELEHDWQTRGHIINQSPIINKIENYELTVHHRVSCVYCI